MPSSISPPATPRGAGEKQSQPATAPRQSVTSTLTAAALSIANEATASRGRLPMRVALESSHAEKLPSDTSSQMSSAAASSLSSAVSSAASSAVSSAASSRTPSPSHARGSATNSANSSGWHIRFKGTYQNLDSSSPAMRGTNLVLPMRDCTPGSEFENQIVVKKVINLKRGSAGEELIRRKADAEVDALIRAKGEGSAKYIEHIVKPNTYEIVMSFIKGETLENMIPWLSEQPPENKVRAVREITRGVIDAVQGLHEKDVCHRDIKPDNIMIERTEDNRFIVKLTDLGMASTVGDASPQSSKTGEEGESHVDAVARHSFGTSKYNIPNSWDKRAIDLDLASIGYTLIEVLKKVDPAAALEVQATIGEEANSFNRPVVKPTFFSNFPDLANFIRDLIPGAGEQLNDAGMLPELQPSEVFAKLKESPWLNP